MSDSADMQARLQRALCDVDDREDCTIEVNAYSEHDDDGGETICRWYVSVGPLGCADVVLEDGFVNREAARKVQAAYESVFGQAVAQLARDQCGWCEGTGRNIVENAVDGVRYIPCTECSS